MITQPRRILCPVDFSECSRRALDHALGLARCYGSTVTALHVVSPVLALAPAPVPGVIVQPVPPPVDRAAITAQVQRMVDAEEVPTVAVDVLVTESPDVRDEVLAQADRLGSDLIVIGTHGRGMVERLFLGSTAERVLRKARCPVVTVPLKAPDAMPRGPAPFARIVCAIDFSPCSELALSHAMALAQESKGALALLHAIEVLPLYYDFSPPVVVDVDAWRQEALQRLRGLVPDDVRGACEVREVAVHGKAYQEILKLAGTMHADLIVMGIQGRGAVDRFFFGSTANHVVRQAGCAVMTVRS
jgi:nucleotide-binding universal stress UspA family protein